MAAETKAYIRTLTDAQILEVLGWDEVDDIVEFLGQDMGFCVGCGAERYNIEPDAHEFPCESCGHNRVYGAEEILLYIAH